MKRTWRTALCALALIVIPLGSCDTPLAPLGGFPEREVPGKSNTAASYTVIFDANGGTPAPPAQTLGQGGKLTDPGAMTKENHTFAGWYQEESFATKWDFKTGAVTAGMVLYAKWDLNRYTVSFNANGGAFPGGGVLVERTVEHGGLVEPPGSPSKGVYSFLGWYSQVIGGELFNPAAPVTGNGSLFARWSGYASIEEVSAYLNSCSGGRDWSDPVFLPVNIDLGDMTRTDSGWWELLDAIDAADRYVELDISTCALSGTEFKYHSWGNTYKYRIVSLALPNTVMGIDAGAFSDYSYLVSITAPAVTTIGGSAFSGSGNLSNITIAAATSIADNAFQGHLNIRSITLTEALDTGQIYNIWLNNAQNIPENVSCPKVTAIGDNAFDGCYSLVSVDFPMAESIGNYAFRGCRGLVSVDFPAATAIGNDAFSNGDYMGQSSSLVSVNLPKAESVGSRAFFGCTSLTSVDFPAVTSIGAGAFSMCFSLASVNLSKTESIGSEVFAGCSRLLSVNFPAVTIISDGAFRDCGLVSVDFPKAESIGSNAFAGCGGLISVTFPAVTSIGNSAFSHNMRTSNLVSVNFPKAESIGSNAFTDCRGLISVTFPAATSIGNSAFSGTGLTSVSFPKATSIGNDAFANCGRLTSVDFPKATSIRAMAFSGCGLTSVNFPNVTSISDGAFSGCTKITSVTIAAATSINSQAFSDCTAIKSITLTEALDTGQIHNIYKDSQDVLENVSCPKVTAIGNSAFDHCQNLVSVDFPMTESIGNGAFYMSRLASVNFPSATSIGNGAFEHCLNLVSVDFPMAESIGNGAFFYCTSLTSVSCPKAESIGDSAFSGTGDTALTITLGNPAPMVGYSMFENIFPIKTVIVRYPTAAAGYGSVPEDTTTENWGNAFRGMNSNIILIYQPY